MNEEMLLGAFLPYSPSRTYPYNCITLLTRTCVLPQLKQVDPKNPLAGIDLVEV